MSACPTSGGPKIKIAKNPFCRKPTLKFRLRNWPISSVDFPMTPMEGTERHFGPFWEKDFGAISSGPLFSRPLCFTAYTTLRAHSPGRGSSSKRREEPSNPNSTYHNKPESERSWVGFARQSAADIQRPTVYHLTRNSYENNSLRIIFRNF